MRTPLLLLKIIAKAALHAWGVGGLWAIVVEDVPELANNVWNDWSAARSHSERRVDLEAVALLGDDDASEVEAVLNEIAPDQAEPIRHELAAYLTQVPASVRQTLRRPTDPTGLTVPPALEPRSGQDLIPFLAARRPRFQAGDRPIPGSDWVLDELLGIGGYGEVWKATHAHFDDFAPVALKFCIDPQARDQLLRHEAKICARVQREGKHPGIVELQHTYLSADTPCLQYEYISGGTLATLIKEFAGRDALPPPDEVARLLLAIATPIAFAHRLDPPIVHRDLKPANVLLQDADGSTRVKITDFGIGGIATATVIRATRQSTHPGRPLTAAVRGSHSPLYASPEQAAGSPPDPRDDVHALGVIWYQMLTGRLTTGPTGGAAWRRRLADRGMAPALMHLLDSCLDEAADRIADAAILHERIEAILSTGETAGQAAEPISSRLGPIAAHPVEKSPASATRPTDTPRPTADVLPISTSSRLAPRSGHTEVAASPVDPVPDAESPAPAPRPEIVLETKTEAVRGSTTDEITPASSDSPTGTRPRSEGAAIPGPDGIEGRYKYGPRLVPIIFLAAFCYLATCGLISLIAAGNLPVTGDSRAIFSTCLIPFVFVDIVATVWVYTVSTSPSRIVLGPTALTVPKLPWSSKERTIAYDDIRKLSLIYLQKSNSPPISSDKALIITHADGKFRILESWLSSKGCLAEIEGTIRERTGIPPSA